MVNKTVLRVAEAEKQNTAIDCIEELVCQQGNDVSHFLEAMRVNSVL